MKAHAASLSASWGKIPDGLKQNMSSGREWQLLPQGLMKDWEHIHDP